MSSAAQIFGAVRAAIPPGTNPFLAIAAVLHKRLYPAIFPAFATSITILHVLYAV